MHVVNLARGMNEGPFRTRLIAGRVAETEGDMAYYARERGVEVTMLDELGREMSPHSDLRVLAALHALFRRERPDVVHTHTAKAGALGRIAASLAGVPVRIHTFHGHVLGGGYFSPARTRFFLEVERVLARLTSRAVVLTRRQATEMSEELRVADRDRFRIVPLGLELHRFAEVDREAVRRMTREKLGLGADDPVVGIVGRLVPVKNHELLLEAMVRVRAELPGTCLLVVGGGEREKQLRDLAGRRGVGPAVRWLGWRSDLPDLYPAMDVLALTSLDEGTPVAVIEALASGTPVVARAVGGVPEILEGGRWGRLVATDRPGDVARALVEALTTDPPRETRTAMREMALERFSVPRLVADLGRLYRDELVRAGRLERAEAHALVPA